MTGLHHGHCSEADNLPAWTKSNFAGPASPGEHFSSGVRGRSLSSDNDKVGFYPIYKSGPMKDV
jgi:hypothetical protein